MKRPVSLLVIALLLSCSNTPDRPPETTDPVGPVQRDDSDRSEPTMRFESPSVRIAPDVTTEPPSLPPLADMLEVYRTVPDDAWLSVELVPGRPVSMDEFREVVDREGIARALVWHGPPDFRRPIGMGTFYDSEAAWDYGVCSFLAQLAVRSGTAVPSIPPEQWMAVEVNVFGQAGPIRRLMEELAFDDQAIRYANRQSPRVAERFAAAVSRENSRTVVFPPGIDVPAQCARFLWTGATH